MSDDGADPNDRSDPLWDAFANPPDVARPRAWWHWMDGNIDPAGVTRDLTWMHAAGIRGVQMFDGGMGVPLVVPETVRPGMTVWHAAIDEAVRVADELGLEFAVATSSGWSAAGGPWVQPTDAMKKVVWAADLIVDGGRHVDISLPALPSAAGLYLDAPRWGAVESLDFVTDWIVLAVPYDASHDVLNPLSVRAQVPVGDWSCLVDGSFDASLSLPRDPNNWSTAWVEQTFDEPVTVRSVVVGLPGPRGFGAAPAPDAVLQASDDGIVYRDVISLESSTVPARSASFAPVTARVFRLVLSADSAASALPPMAEGIRIPPVLRRADAFVISEFALRTGGRVHHAETKAGFGVVADYYAIDTDPRSDVGAMDPSAVLDLTAQVCDGILGWEAPRGRWRILRLGASLTGQTNGPAPADSTGLEVDKLDGERVSRYLETHLTRFGDTGQPEVSRFDALLSDSIEAGPQNWTDRILEHFAAHRGYSALRWLPVLTGMLVGSAAQSDRFLFDYRRTLSELLADKYYGTLAAAAHERGMTYYAEALEDGRPQLGDDLAMRAHADTPMGAMWTFDPLEGPRPTYTADLKGASSVAHVYGKKWTGSEAFTSFGRPWSWSPQSLKHIADLQLSLGVTRFCIHTSPHQPTAAPPPGIALAPFLGQSFTISETWSGMARPWIDYLARCSAMLSAGLPVVDFAIFIGEEAPVTGLFEKSLDTTVPPDFDFDYVGGDALSTILRVDGDSIVSKGASYRLLVLGGSSHRMTVAALRHVERLLDAGATVVGIRPDSSPSLADETSEFESVCDRIWAADRPHGRVIATDLAAAIDQLGLRPTVKIDGDTVRRISRMIDGRCVTFLANPSAEELSVRVHTGLDSKDLIGWDPVEVRRIALSSVSDSHGRTYEIPLCAFGSLFVLEDLPVIELVHTRSALDGDWFAQVPGGGPITTAPCPQFWTDFGATERGFSGTGVYSHAFELTQAQARADEILIQFEAIGEIARVVLNGYDCGIVWTAPFRVDVSTAIQAGANFLEVHVATPWRNRLIAEASVPSGEIFAPMTTVFETTASVSPAGLSGKVWLLVAGQSH